MSSWSNVGMWRLTSRLTGDLVKFIDGLTGLTIYLWFCLTRKVLRRWAMFFQWIPECWRSGESWDCTAVNCSCFDGLTGLTGMCSRWFVLDAETTDLVGIHTDGNEQLSVMRFSVGGWSSLLLQTSLLLTTVPNMPFSLFVLLQTAACWLSDLMITSFTFTRFRTEGGSTADMGSARWVFKATNRTLATAELWLVQGLQLSLSSPVGL